MCGDDWDFEVISEDGQVIRWGTGEVVGPLVEGTLDYPARHVTDPPLNRRGVLAIGVRMNSNNRELEDLVSRVEGVLTKHGIKFHKPQAEELARRLKAIGGRTTRLIKVLDCVLDPGCIKFGPELRIPVEKAFEGVFGLDAVIKAQITEELGRSDFNGLFSVDDVYDAYRELYTLYRSLRSKRLLRGNVYRQTLIRAAIIDLVLRSISPSEIPTAEHYIRKKFGWERPLKLLKRLKQHPP